MAFDPAQEEYERLALSYARSLDDADSFQAARTASAFRRRFAWNHDSLPQNDRDRAFHLVVRAARLIDEELPFAQDDQAPALIVEARRLLDEAVSLDPRCHDALRMEAAQECPSFESYYRYLVDGLPQVREEILARQAELLAQGHPHEASLATRPLLRWLANLADKALVCGRYHRCLEFCREALELDPRDMADVRYTAYLALAKLEDAEGLEQLARTHERPAAHGLTPAGTEPVNGWLGLSRAAVRLRRGDERGAREAIHDLLVSYPQPGITLAFQGEIPDPAFARLAVPAFSPDELALAVSEGCVLLQEGVGRNDSGSLGSFVAQDRAVQAAATREQEAMRRMGAPLGGSTGDEGEVG